MKAVSEAIRFAEEYGYRERLAAQDAFTRILKDRDKARREARKYEAAYGRAMRRIEQAGGRA